MNGFINLRKAAGETSRQAVNHIQRLVRPAKVGHAGTLDPLATGVLPIAIGAATRLVEYLQEQAKTYRATFLLGRESDTEDVEGNVVELTNPPQPTLRDVEKTLPQFVGRIDQRPPAFSALKVQGQRAYDLARRGEEVELASRTIEIHALRLLAYDYPQLELEIACGSGTYVRSLGRDIARSLGSGAVMSALERTVVGPFRVESAVAVGELTSRNILNYLQPLSLAVTHLLRVDLTATELTAVRQGKTIVATGAPMSDGTISAAFGPDHQLHALLERRDNTWKPHRVFNI